MPFVRKAALLLGALAATGCASILNSSPGDLNVTSVPEGADVALDELDPSCQTPCELEIKPARYELHVKKAGYKPETVALVKRMSPWFWVNFVMGPGVLVGMGIDALTGSIFRLSPKEVKVRLMPLNAEKAAEENQDDEENAVEEEDEVDDVAPAPAAPAPKGDDRLPSVATPPPEEPPLPRTPAAQHVKEAVPEAAIDREITLYYGSVQGKRRETLKRRLYNIMLEQVKNGDRADIDEAVKTERFRFP